jgi:plasmid stability protein
MASLVIRNLDDAVAQRLRLQARQRGVSVEQEARRVLAEGTVVARREIAARARAIRARQPRHRSRAVDLVRADRAR